MHECWAVQLADRPALADVTRRLQSMCMAPARQAASDGGLMIINPTFDSSALADGSEL